MSEWVPSSTPAGTVGVAAGSSRMSDKSNDKGKPRTNCCGAVVQDANFDCSSTGFALQAMDSSHVSLIHMQV